MKNNSLVPTEAPALEITDLTVRYGRTNLALNTVSLVVHQAEVVTLMGLNGAGKTTLARSVTGLISQSGGAIVEGRISAFGAEITGQSPRQIIKAGVSQSMEGRRIFAELTVQENLDTGAATRRKSPELSRQQEWVFELFPRLAERRGQVAGYLSGGEQQMLAVGRALMQSPKLLILDEPTLGLSPKFVRIIGETVQAIRSTGASVLLIEQNANMALSVSDRGYILSGGRIAQEGTAMELQADPKLSNRLLGVDHEQEATL
ncbi:ABC transporter ATP-binding protein [Pseudarthrobacter sp. NPDC058329]|uniref:ABC transporter ATP-binding protein n=1 Tax=Pseudarthrobacter sp. NPDC058329 TaxID=3346448 RepID=UPI0036D8F2B7